MTSASSPRSASIFPASAWARFALKLVIGGTLIGLLLWRVDVSQLWTSLRAFSAGTFAWTIAVFLTSCLLSALRWWLLLPEASYARLLRYSFVGQFYAVVLPGQIAGEAMKAYRLASGNLGAERVAASVLLDRLVGTLALALTATVGLLYSRSTVAVGLLPAFALVVGGLFTLFIVFSMPAATHRVRNLLRSPRIRPQVISKLSVRLAALLESLHAFYGAWLRLAGSFGIGMVFHLMAVTIYCGLAASIGIDVAWVDWLWIVGVTSIAVLLPVSVGGLGLREGALVGCLSAFGVPIAQSMALSFAIFAIMLLGAAIGGVCELLGRRRDGGETQT